MESFLNIAQTIGVLSMIFGLGTLCFLQISLGRKEKKSFFTFLSILFYSNDRLTAGEKKLKTIGGITLFLGVVLILLSGYEAVIDSFANFLKPPEIINK